MDKDKGNTYLDNFKILNDVTKTLLFVTGCVLIGFSMIYWGSGIANKTTAVFWSLACLASGGIIGFLFGIPRVLQDGPAVAVRNNNDKSGGNDDSHTDNNKTNKNVPLNYRIMVNTNLEQISDWLTKIIVGIGLIELRNVPGYLNNLSVFFASGLDGELPVKQSLASAIIVYFVVVGFLGVYLMTRIYLAQVFSKADRETQETAKLKHARLTLEEATGQMWKELESFKSVFNKNKPIAATPQKRGTFVRKLKIK